MHVDHNFCDTWGRRVRERMYRGLNKGLHVLLSRIQAEPGRKVKQEQGEISRNHVQTFIYLSVHTLQYRVVTPTFTYVYIARVPPSL